MKDKFANWLSRWRLKRIILALHYATDYGLKTEVHDFAKALEASSLMARGLKKDAEVTIVAEREQLDAFITYMTKLHSSKLSLILRARIGLATLALKDSYVLGDEPIDFVKREYPKTKSAADDKIIQLIK